MEVQQKKVLLNETNQTNQVVQELKSKESKLLADIEKNKKVAARVNKAINDLIEREMAKAAKAAEEAAKKTSASEGAKPGGAKSNIRTATSGGPDVAVNNVPASTTPKARAEVSLMLTPEDMELAGNFENNRGRMYWPVEKGYITDRFGPHPHPLYPKVMMDNAGIDIQTDEGAKVRCIFKGTVSRIFTVEGSRWIVMVMHGNYFTLYNGLANVAVKVGDELSAKQTVGTVSQNDEGLPVINFQIWKGGKSQVKLNPEQWIGKVH
jgi:septal ring factor EnvC (AmiA/AmiB activator)